MNSRLEEGKRDSTCYLLRVMVVHILQILNKCVSGVAAMIADVLKRHVLLLFFFFYQATDLGGSLSSS